jgi:hypothetical protein
VSRWLFFACPKTHEKFPISFGNAEVISSDRRKLFINIFSQNYLETFHKFTGDIKEILRKSLQCTNVGASPQRLDQKRRFYTGKSQCFSNPSVPLQLADEKSRIY